MSRPRTRSPLPAHSQGAAAVRRARKLLGLAQKDLGAALGLQGLSVSRWETARVGVPLPHRRALVSLLAARDPKAAGALAKDLGVVDPGTGARRDPKARRAELDAVVLRTAEALDVVPSLARRTAIEVIQRLARIDMSPREAMSLLGLEVVGTFAGLDGGGV